MGWLIETANTKFLFYGKKNMIYPNLLFIALNERSWRGHSIGPHDSLFSLPIEIRYYVAVRDILLMWRFFNSIVVPRSSMYYISLSSGRSKRTAQRIVELWGRGNRRVDNLFTTRSYRCNSSTSIITLFSFVLTFKSTPFFVLSSFHSVLRNLSCSCGPCQRWY